MRITDKQLDNLIMRINKAAGTPLQPYSVTPIKPNTANVGNYHLDSAYGGNKLVQMDNDCGGIRVISEGGYITKRELYNQLLMLLRGLEHDYTTNS